MDQIFRILKQLTGTAGVLGAIPKPIKMFLVYFGVLVSVIAIIKYAPLGSTTKTFLVIGIIVVAVIVSIYLGVKAWKQKKQNQQFGGEISQHSLATPRGLSDPGQRARLDDMRKKFQSGVEAYKSRGKDLYKLPWYVIVGEPGSGKTEAIRHSNVGFPPGMQDEFQGVGGTINMNWWFTNHAVLLDTAGRLMFEELKPGETSEWREFLTLLKKNRPTCPINGLFLVIPSDSLIKDSADSIQKKAGKIAQQLDVIQRVLDVRFPVFVVVTKCDKINGFREFFDGITDPQLQHQMMGWSNPSPLDDPFKPEMVDKHLEQVGARLRRRRMGLMRDPAPESADGRRTDEVDCLFALPHSLEMLSSRLRRYLETIFIAGEWSAKPLFLRGIYFSSAMREGAALDAELAEAIGVSVDELPEGKVWERERAYFLRDLFLEKVFREKGLVTSASNTKHMLRSQQIALYGFGFASLTLFCVIAWFALRSMRSGVKDHGDYWKAVAAEEWQDKHWKHTIVPVVGDGSYAATLSTNLITVDASKVTLGEYEWRLCELTAEPMKKSIVFPMLAANYNEHSRSAQRAMFELGVIQPLVEATRQKMSRSTSETESTPGQPDALAELIQIEADILAHGMPNHTGQVTPDAARKFLTAFETYMAGHEEPADSNLVATMVWTYSTNDTAKGSWAPRWLTGGHGTTNDLSVNTGIAAGLELLAHNATNDIQKFRSDQDAIAGLRKLTLQFATNENNLAAAALAGLETNFLDAQRDLDATRKKLDEDLGNLAREPLFVDGLLLVNGQQKFRDEVTKSAGAKVGHVRSVNEAALAAFQDHPLFVQIKERLATIQISLSSTVSELLHSGDSNEFQQLDANYLAAGAYVTRADMYDKAQKLADPGAWSGGELIGTRAEKLDNALGAQATQLRSALAAYAGKQTNEARLIVEYNLRRAAKNQSVAFFSNYIAEAKKTLGPDIGFPLLRDFAHVRPMTVDNFKSAARNLKFIGDDFASPAFTNYGPRDFADWKQFKRASEAQQMLVKALLGDDGSPGVCHISLESATDATQKDDEWRSTYRDIQLIFDGGKPDAVRTESDKDQLMGDVPVQAKLELRLIRNANQAGSPMAKIFASDWGPMWLIQSSWQAQHSRVEQDKKNPAIWHVRFPLDAQDAKGSVRLKLDFERPMPDIEDLPLK